MAELGRLLTAMVTPFTDKGEVDYPRARELAKAVLKSGSDGLVIGGTTGEAPSMSDDEKLRLYAEVKEAIGEDGAVVAGATDNNTRAAVLFQSALDNDNDGCHQTLVDFAQLMQRVGRIGDAVRLLRRAVAAVPGEPEWRQWLKDAEKELAAAPN